MNDLKDDGAGPVEREVMTLVYGIHIAACPMDKLTRECEIRSAIRALEQKGAADVDHT